MKDFKYGFETGKNVCLYILRKEIAKCEEIEKDLNFCDNKSLARERNLNYLEILKKVEQEMRCFFFE